MYVDLNKTRGARYNYMLALFTTTTSIKTNIWAECKNEQPLTRWTILFSKPNVNDCSKDLIKHAMVLSFLTSDKKSSRNSVSDCHHRCPWSTHCDQCPNCKWCWLCSSCSVPNKNCKYCRVCKGKESDCAKCCGY